jgi:sarcosine oxidase
MRYDIAVVGLGGIGSAILAQSAARGASVVGVEQFGPAHAFGSSHGKSRMIRKAYFEEPAYVPLLRRAFELWRELEIAANAEILRVTGVLTVGDPASNIIKGTQRAAIEHDLPLESLGHEKVRARYPTLRLLADEVALLETEAGVLKPEEAIKAHLSVAHSHHAEMHFNLAMKNWQATATGFEILLWDGRRISARKLVLALGPWFKEALDALGVQVRVQRNVQVWFSPATNVYAAPGFPSFLLNRQDLPAPLYGFPDFGDGVKVAFHGAGEETDAPHLKREVDATRDIAPLVRAMEEWMPGATNTLKDASACMYTLTPDEHFVIDRHPEYPDLILCGGFSGHGFKFAPVIGEIATELALDGGTRHQIDFLSLRRFRACQGGSS